MNKQRGVTELEKAAIIEQIKWSQPMGLKKWADVFGTYSNTMQAWFKNQIVRNKQMSPRIWRVAVKDLPADLVINAFPGASLPKA